jgi:phosphatidate cytidylyltransferase
VREILKRSLTGIILVVLFMGSILLGPAAFMGVLIVIYGLGLRELFRLLTPGHWFPAGMIAVSGALLIAILYLALQFHASPLWLLLPFVLWILAYLWPGHGYVAGLSMLWLSIPLASFYALGWMLGAGGYRPLLPLSVISLVWIYDIFAYLSGSLLGKHPMTPKLSPGKTWEGSAGGLLVTLFSAWLFSEWTGILGPSAWMAIALLVCVLGLAGDLFESALKRKHRVKDMGSLLPGHGGILDRFDSLLFVSPALVLLFILQALFA